MAVLPAALLITASNCSRQESPAASREPGETIHRPAQSQPAEADTTQLLSALTLQLRKYSMEKQQVPPDLGELVRAGYLKALPTAPAGKRFAIDERRVEVVLVNR